MDTVISEYFTEYIKVNITAANNLWPLEDF